MTPHLRVCIRIFAALDLAVVACFAVPGLAALFMHAIGALGVALGLAPLTLPVTALGWLFVHIAGVLGMLWALARLIRPSRLLAGLDSLGRCPVAALIVYAVIGSGVSGVVWLFVASEAAGAVLQGGLLLRPAASVGRP